MQHSDTSDQNKLALVAQAIAAAMGHEERWQTYLTVARMHIAGFAACQAIEKADGDAFRRELEQIRKNVETERKQKRGRWCR